MGTTKTKAISNGNGLGFFGFRVEGLRLSGFRILGFWALGIRVLGRFVVLLLLDCLGSRVGDGL